LEIKHYALYRVSIKNGTQLVYFDGRTRQYEGN
jgi:hypothetical protein